MAHPNNVKDRTAISIDLINLTASGLATIAVLVGSFLSLQIWRALRTHDAAASHTPSSELRQRTNRERALNLFGIFSVAAVECYLIYATLVDSVSGVHWGSSVIVAGLICMGLSTIFVALISDLTVSRVNDAAEAEHSNVIRVAKEHIKRSIAATISAFAIGIWSTIYPSQNVFFMAVAGLVYRLTARPAFLLGRGWLSLRVAIMACLALFVFVWLVVCAVIFVIIPKHARDELRSPRSAESHATSAAITMEFHAMNRILVHMFNVASGTVIALVLRYEFSRSEAGKAAQKELDDTFPINTKESPAYGVNPADFTVKVPRTNPNFCAPIFGLSVLALVAAHIPATVLAIPRFHHLYTTDQGCYMINLAFKVLAGTPPQVWGLLMVPSVVIIACLIRGDGGELWKYAERWDLPNNRASMAPQMNSTRLSQDKDIKHSQINEVTGFF